MRLFIYFLALLMLSTSCTAYNYKIETKGSPEIKKTDLQNLKVNQKVFVKMNNGKIYKGRVMEISDDYFILGGKNMPNSGIYYELIAKIKHEEDRKATIVKIALIPIGAFLLLYILFNENLILNVGPSFE